MAITASIPVTVTAPSTTILYSNACSTVLPYPVADLGLHYPDPFVTTTMLASQVGTANGSVSPYSANGTTNWPARTPVVLADATSPTGASLRFHWDVAGTNGTPADRDQIRTMLIKGIGAQQTLSFRARYRFPIGYTINTTNFIKKTMRFRRISGGDTPVGTLTIHQGRWNYVQELFGGANHFSVGASNHPQVDNAWHTIEMLIDYSAQTSTTGTIYQDGVAVIGPLTLANSAQPGGVWANGATQVWLGDTYNEPEFNQDDYWRDTVVATGYIGV